MLIDLTFVVSEVLNTLTIYEYEKIIEHITTTFFPPELQYGLLPNFVAGRC